MAAPCIPEEGFWSEEWGGYWSAGESRLLGALFAFLPVGEPWPRDPCTWMGRLLNGIGFGLERASMVLDDIAHNEAFPTTTIQCLDLWEELYGLPLPCYKPISLQKRREILLAKIQFKGPPTQETFIEMGMALGAPSIEFVHEGDAFYVGDNVGDYLKGPSWDNVWTVKYPDGPWSAAIQCLFDYYKYFFMIYVYEPF